MAGPCGSPSLACRPPTSQLNAPTHDARAAELHAWLATQLDGAGFSLASASTDASFRRYFRVAGEGPCRIAPHARTLIVMDAPPPREDCRPFVHVASLLREAGLHAPRVLAQDIERGFLLLDDLGTTTYLEALNSENFSTLFGDATAALVRWQAATRADALPPYDEALIRRELGLFSEWYVERHLEATLTDTEKHDLDRIFALLVDVFNAQPRVFVHRDFMPRNLMVSDPNPGVLDFQDAVLGPIAYDVLCLFKDAFLSWPEERVLDGAVRYWEKARRARLPVPADFTEFFRWFEWTGVQRHLKVLGIFARIRHRDGKPGYVEDTPRFVAYLRPIAQRYREFEPLAHLFDRLEAHSRAIGCAS